MTNETQRKRPEYKQAARFKWILHSLFTSETDVQKQTRDDHIHKEFLACPTDFNGCTLVFGARDENVDIYFHDVPWSALPKTFDVKFAFYRREVAKDGFPLMFGRVRRVPVKELRRFKLHSDKVVQCYYAGFEGGKFYPAKRYYALLPNGNWERLGRGETIPNPDPRGDYARGYLDPPTILTPADEGHSMINFGLSVAFSDHYQWKVQFTDQRGQSMRIAVHPKQIRNLFRLREKYTDRRQALKHLVRGHWRTIDKDEVFDIETYVRTYLRGQLFFQWFNMHCQIIVPTTIKEDIRRQKLARELMRLDVPRSDRRKMFASASR